MLVSVIVPACNEEALIGDTLTSLFSACTELQASRKDGARCVEIFVVDSNSSDRTAAIVRAHEGRFGLRLLGSPTEGAGAARNRGALFSKGSILCFLDADTLLPPAALRRVVEACERGYAGGFCRLGPRDGGVRAAVWWYFWSQVRRLPLPRAKAMSAFMWCEREAWRVHGPFDTEINLGEEWKVLAGLYRSSRQRFRYDWTLLVRTSSRRMELQWLGYVRTFARYVWAVLFASGRRFYPAVRHGSQRS